MDMCCRASCIVYLTSTWSKTCSAEHCWFTRAWFCAHPGCCILREHVASTQGSNWLLSKPTFQFPQSNGRVGRHSDWFKEQWLNQPKARESCTMHCMCHTKSCRIMCLASKQLWQFEQRVLQTGSSEGELQWQREGQQLCSTGYTCVAQHVIRVCITISPGPQNLESMVAHEFVKHGFKMLLHLVVDGPVQASGCLVLQSMNELCLFKYPAMSCIWGLR